MSQMMMSHRHVTHTSIFLGYRDSLEMVSHHQYIDVCRCVAHHCNTAPPVSMTPPAAKYRGTHTHDYCFNDCVRSDEIPHDIHHDGPITLLASLV